MAETTTISWCDRTWSPWYGCTQISMGENGACVGCYARQLSEIRMGRVVFGGPGRGEGTRDARADSAWLDPIRWNKGAPGSFIFPSMCDPFDNHPALVRLRLQFFNLIWGTPDLYWLLLTKRPGNIVKLFQETMGTEGALADHWPRNAAIGCTVVTQEEADRDIPKLLTAKSALNPAFTFVSMEPLLGPVDVGRWLVCSGCADETGPHAYAPRPITDPVLRFCGNPRLDWVITGGESDQGAHQARPPHPDWFRAPRDQCAAAGVPFHHKQNGEWAACAENTGGTWLTDGEKFCRLEASGARTDTGWPMQKVGKKHAGRLLDGQLHDARPAL